ncbi:MAG: hypothetical protein ABII74_09000 [Elusimicrobiota bacterium]
MSLKKLISHILLVSFIFTIFGQNYAWAVRNDRLFHALRPPNRGSVNKENSLVEKAKQNLKSEYDWGKFLEPNFFIDLFQKDISKYPRKLKLDDIGRYLVSFGLIFPTFTIADLHKTGFTNPLGSVLFGLAVAVGYIFSNTFFNWNTDIIPHLKRDKGFKYNLKLFFNKEYFNPGKHGRAMLTKGGGTIWFMALSFGIFYVFSPLLVSAVWAWVFWTTVFLGTYGGSYDGYMRAKQYPEPHILRAEYIRNYSITFLSIIITLFFNPDPVLYLIIRRFIGDFSAAIIDLRGAFTTYLISPSVKISLPFSEKLKIYEEGKEKPRIIDLKAFNAKWVYHKAETMFYLTKTFFGEDRRSFPKDSKLLETFPPGATVKEEDERMTEWLDYVKLKIDKSEGNLNNQLKEKLGCDLNDKEGLKKFAETVMRGVETFSLKDESIQKIFNDKIINKDEVKDKLEKMNINIQEQPREVFALFSFLTKPVEEKWENMLEYKQFSKQPVKIVIINEEDARESKVVSEELIMDDGVFADTDSGCIIILNKRWNSPLELLLKLERARAKLEIFTEVAENISLNFTVDNKETEFAKHLVIYHRQWYQFKFDPFYSSIRALLEGRRQKLAFQYAREFVGLEEFFRDGRKSNIKSLGIFEDYCLVPAAFPQGSVLSSMKIDSYIVYRYFLEFVKFVRLKDRERGLTLTDTKSEKFLDEFIFYWSANNELGKDIWQSLSDYTKDMNKMGKERFIDWFDKNVLIPEKVVVATTVLLIAAYSLMYNGLTFSVILLLPMLGISFSVRIFFSNKKIKFKQLLKKKHYQALVSAV